MNIAQVVRRFTFREWGGTECVVWNTSKTLPQFGDRAEIVATRALDATAFEERDGVEIRRFGYHYPYFPLSAARRLALDKKGGNPYAPALGHYLESGNFDLLHCHAMGRIAARVRLAARRLNIPYVVSFHGGCFEVPESEMREMLKPIRRTLKYGAVCDRFMGLRCDPLADAAGLLCVGANELKPTRERYPDKLVEYLPNGVDVARFAAPSAVDFRGKYGIPRERALLLSVSRIDYQKNQLLLLEATARLAARGVDVHLALVGPATSAWYLEKLNARMNEPDLKGRVTVIPGLPPDSPDLPAAYQAAQVFCLASLHEPFGIVVLEAWSAGVPVIASPVGGLCSLIRGEETGLFADSADPEAWVAACERMLAPGNADWRGRLVAAASGEAHERYSWTSVTRRLHDFYDAVQTAHCGR